MSLDFLICGFLGGFLLSIIPYTERLNDIQPEEDTKNSMNNWKYIQQIFNIGGLLHCVVCGLFGIVIVWVIDPKESLYAIYLGMTAYPTMSKFFVALNPLNKSA